MSAHQPTINQAIVLVRAQAARFVTAAEVLAQAEANNSTEQQAWAADVLLSAVRCLDFPIDCLEGRGVWGRSSDDARG